MGTKRPADDAEHAPARSHVRYPKKTKLSPSAGQRRNSSEPSSCSISEDSALQSSPTTSAHIHHSSLSSIEHTHEESESSSSSSDSTSESEDDSSSEEDDDDDELYEDDEIVTLGGPKKPSIAIGGAQNARMTDLHGRLQNMLSQLAQANGELEGDANAYSMENVEDDEPHIEMNLGLGVLEEINADTSSTEDESSDDGMPDEGEEDDDTSTRSTTHRMASKRDAMSTLLGRDPELQKAEIQVLEET